VKAISEGGRKGRTVDFAPPLLCDAEVAEVAEALRSGWLTTGPRAARLEESFARYVGAPAALAVSSGTAALHLGLLVAGVGPGDRVVSSVMTFPGVVGLIEQVGAEPVLVDIEGDTLNPDPEEVVRCFEELRPQPRAILPVHLYGHPCELDRLRGVGRGHGAAIVEDAAHALPALYRGETIGSGGTLAAFSFYATKPLTTGEGGMLVGAPELIEEARVMSLHGISRPPEAGAAGHGWDYELVAAGFKYNLADVLAAIGLAQLRRQDEFLARRRAVAARYHAALSRRDDLHLPIERPEVESSWHIYALRLRLEQLRIDRDRFVDEMRSRGIETSVHFRPVHLHRYFRERHGLKPGDFPVAHDAYPRLVSLPMHPGLSDDDVDAVASAVEDVLARFRR